MAYYLVQSDATGIIPATSVEQGFTDVTNIINLATYAVANIGAGWISDWKKIRMLIKDIAVATTGNSDIPNWTIQQWGMFSDEEQYWLCQFMPNKINPAYMFATLGSLEAIASAGLYFDTNSKIARQRRWEACRIKVINNFTIQVIMANIQHAVLAFTNADWPNSCDLSRNYVLGYEQQSEDFKYGLIDWVNNELLNSGWTVTNPTDPTKTMAQVVAELNSILIDGNYTLPS